MDWREANILKIKAIRAYEAGRARVAPDGLDAESRELWLYWYDKMSTLRAAQAQQEADMETGRKRRARQVFYSGIRWRGV